MAQKTRYIAAGLLGGFSVGVAIGYIFTEKTLAAEFDARAQAEVEAAKEHYQKLHKTGDYSTIDSAVLALHKSEGLRLENPTEDEFKELKERLSVEGYAQEEEQEFDTPEPVEETTNVFDQPYVPDDPSEDTPYVVSLEEYSDEFTHHDKLTLTYFEGDDTLVDEGQNLISDVDMVIGLSTLNRFGEGPSHDDNVVYVRNQALGADYEVIREETSYTEVVLGLDFEHLEESHSKDKKRPPKLREDD